MLFRSRHQPNVGGNIHASSFVRIPGELCFVKLQHNNPSLDRCNDILYIRYSVTNQTPNGNERVFNFCVLDDEPEQYRDTKTIDDNLRDHFASIIYEKAIQLLNSLSSPLFQGGASLDHNCVFDILHSLNDRLMLLENANK